MKGIFRGPWMIIVLSTLAYPVWVPTHSRGKVRVVWGTVVGTSGALAKAHSHEVSLGKEPKDETMSQMGGSR